MSFSTHYDAEISEKRMNYSSQSRLEVKVDDFCFYGKSLSGDKIRAWQDGGGVQIFVLLSGTLSCCLLSSKVFSTFSMTKALQLMSLGSHF